MLNQKKALGKQFLAELYDCDSKMLNDKQKIAQILEDAAVFSGAKVLGSTFHQFSPQGVSGMVLLSESHLAIHTWPEHDFASIDLFACGSKMDTDACLEFVKKELKASLSEVTKVQRGVFKERKK